MSYPNEARGGPLFFVIMMELLLSQTEEAVIALQTKLKKMDLKSIPGENVERAVSLSRAALVRLETFGKVPDDIIRILLRIFQTSSVPAFNEFFHHLEQQRKVEQAMSTTKTEETNVTTQNILRAATIQYRSLWEENLWTGVRNGTSTFSTSTTANDKGGKSPHSKCWNCGDVNHSLPNCPKPLNKAKISESKKAFSKALKKAKETGSDSKSTTTSKTTGNVPGKWRPPAPEENNRRTIDGRAMWWSAKTHRWYPDRNASSGTPAPVSLATATATVPTSVTTTQSVNTVTPAPNPGGPSVDARIQATKAAFANAYAVVMQQLDQAGI
jgi:hypothetical protein